MLDIINSEKLGDLGHSELFCVNEISKHKVRKANVIFGYTEAELTVLKNLSTDVIQHYCNASKQIRNLIISSILNHKEIKCLFVTRHTKASFDTFMTIYEKLPYYVQPGFVEITKYGFKLDNGFELKIE
jgi:hypothetical protein